MLLVVVLNVLIVRTLFSEEFLPAVPLIRIIAPGMFVYAGASVLATYFRGTNRPSICSWAVAGGVVVNAVIVPLSYPAFGLEAAALGMAASLIVRGVILAVAYCRVTGSPVSLNWWPQPEDDIRLRELTRTTIVRFFSGGRSARE